LVAAIKDLAITLRPNGIEKLENKEDIYRIRVEDYRVIYTIEDGKLLILVIYAEHRKDVYGKF
jgi:mRNA interferase RelE/StbE